MKHLKLKHQHKHLGVLALLGAALLLLFSSSVAQAINDPIQLSSKLSQTTFVQGGSSNTVYLDVVIKAPQFQVTQRPVRATDMMIILDRSGSMGGSKKMPYAKAAIRDVLSRLTQNDRFSLVSFSNDAIVHSPFITVTPEDRENLNRIVNSIPASGGTNMSDGLQAALRLAVTNQSPRAKKILLLSDGQANQGIISPQGLAGIVTQITQSGAVLSTIGMGLDFNETLMTNLSDYGMGHYSYLENLSGLGAILAKDLSDTRRIFANGSNLELYLGQGVQIIDAGGYPITQLSSNTRRITTGQILDNTDKHFVITLTIPTHQVGTVSLGNMQLNYQSQNANYQTPLATNLNITIVEAARREEAVRSVDSDVYKQSWLTNNLGRMKKALSSSLRSGDKVKAKKDIYEYRQAIKKAEKESKVKILSPSVAAELNDMEEEVDAVFVGNISEQEEKRKRSSKSIQQESIKQQR